MAKIMRAIFFSFNTDKIQENFLNRLKKYQVLTFTLAFLFVYRFVGTLIFYFAGEETFLENSGLSIWFFLIAIPSAYFLQWIVATWVASKNPVKLLQEKFYHHPIATIIISVSFMVDLQHRIFPYESMSGLPWIINIFEVIIYYAFLSFLWWLLACWISGKIWSGQKFKWGWYKKVIDIIFILLPPIYKLVLGIVFALLVFLLLFMIITNILNYSGSDLQKLLL